MTPPLLALPDAPEPRRPKRKQRPAPNESYYGHFKGRQRLHAQDLAILLVKMKDRAGRIGLWKTMHALDAATKEIGWEIAEKMKRQP